MTFKSDSASTVVLPLSCVAESPISKMVKMAMGKRKPFLVRQKKVEINDFVMKNLIYCEDTHSFVHRLMQKWDDNFPMTTLQAQEDAWDVVREMNEEEKR